MTRDPDDNDAMNAHDEPDINDAQDGTDASETDGGSDEDDSMMQDPESSEGEPPGGRAAERLREHLEERFGEDAPPVPPDELDAAEDEAPSDGSEEAEPDA